MKKNLIFFFILWSLTMHAWFFNSAPEKPFIIMLEASGDSQHPGRTIDDSFEASITLQIAHALKNKLSEQFPNTKIIINRSANEAVAPLQNANFANKLDVDLYISINAFAETETKPRIFVYQFSYQDNTIAKKNDLSFYSFDKIYLLNEPQTNAWAQKIIHSLKPHNEFTILLHKIPFKPLIGIKAPALGFEIGLKNKNDWQQFIEPLAESLMPIITRKS